MKLLILWAQLADYTVASFKALSSIKDVEIHLVYQPVHSEAPFSAFDLSFCKTHVEDNGAVKRSLVDTCVELNPDGIIMASWNYSHYMKISRVCKGKGTYVVSTFDAQWQNTLRQNIGRLISRFLLYPAINTFLVPGDRQSQFARKLGYNAPWQGFYCANDKRFSSGALLLDKPSFLFVGRLVKQKGIDSLMEAYKQYRISVSEPWDLTVAGTGPLESVCKNIEGVNLTGFVQPENLPSILQNANCLILPSLHEPWGLVVHEAVLNGLQVICSHYVGSSTWFVRDGQNGFIVEPDVQSLTNSMCKISNQSVSQRIEAESFSQNLGSLWTTDKWAQYVHANFQIAINQVSTRGNN